MKSVGLMGLLVLMMQSSMVMSAPCSTPISIAYGPYISLHFINHIFSRMHTTLEQRTGCAVAYQAYSDFEEFLRALVNLNHNLIVAPGVYKNTLQELAYTPVVVIGRKAGYGVVFTSRESKAKNLNDLKGKSISTLSPYSGLSLKLKQMLDDQNILPYVNLDYMGNSEAIVMAVIRGKTDAGVVMAGYWNKLDERLRQSNLRIVTPMPEFSRGTVMLTPDLAPHFDVIQKVYLEQKIVVWEKPSQFAPSEKLEAIEAVIKTFVGDLLDKEQ